MANRTVHDYKIGDRIQGTTVKGPSVPITDITPLSHGKWEIHCAYGVYVVSYNELLSFPRRLDGSVRDWMDEEELPTPASLAVGDTLPPARSIDEIIIPGARLPQGVTWDTIYRRYIQRVVGVQKYLNTGIALIDTVTDYEPDSRERPTRRTFGFRLDQDIVMPCSEWNPRLGKAAAQVEDMKKCGPYELMSNHDTTYWFLVHPTGKGRWPAGTPEFEIIDEPGEYTMRPPSGISADVRAAWKQFQQKYVDPKDGHFIPHPQDLTPEMKKQRYQNWKMRPGR